MKKMMVIALVGFICAMGLASTNEITYRVYLDIAKDTLALTEDSGSVLQQMTGTRYHSYIVVCTNGVPTPLAKGAVGDLGKCVMVNLSTNPAYRIWISNNNGAETNQVLEAGEYNGFRWAPGAVITNTCVGITNATGTADLKITIIEK